MNRSVLILAAAVALVAAPAAAQSWSQDHGGYRPQRSNAVPSNFDWRSQLDRPGDYRCDQYWDASRDDCGDRSRDQRHRVSPQARSDYRALAGYGYGPRYGHSHNRRGYGSAYGHAQGSTTFHGAYGRPDHVYPGGGTSYGGHHSGYNSGHGRGYGGGGYAGGGTSYGGYNSGYNSGHGGGYAGGGYAGGHGGGRADWCRATYRSYNPATGYYRGYSGQLIYCG